MNEPASAVARARALTVDWQARQGTPPEVRTATERAIARWEIDRARFSDVLEPSLSWDEAGASWHRWSYAFPGHRAALDETARAMSDIIEPLGAAARAACAKVLWAARASCVAQPIVGVADDGAAGVRAKLYLQFKDGVPADAAALSRALLGTSRDLAALGPSLHMVGLDVGRAGVRGAKLYYAGAPQGGDDIARLLRIAPHPTLPSLRAPLLIHRVTSREADAISDAVEIDFSLRDEGIAWEPLTRSPLLEPWADALAEFSSLATAHRLRVRRISLGLPPQRKLNLYYVLDEQ